MAMADITVRGAGVFGLSIAWECLRRGARVQVVDPHGPGAGASGGLVGALAPHVPENWNDKKAFQLDSLLMAGQFWAEVAQAGGQDPGYARTGRYQPIADEAALALAKARATGAIALWQGQADWQIVAQKTAGPLAPESPTGLLIYDTLSARLHPQATCRALAAAIAARGGQIATDAPDQGLVVHATGVAGLREISAECGKNFGDGVKGQAALLGVAHPMAPQVFANGVHIVPHADGTIAIGSTSERFFDSPDSTDTQLDAVINAACTALPILRDAPVLARWAGLRPRARSRAPVLGAHPTRAGQFIANGGFKIGFGMAPKVAQTMALLLLEGQDIIPDGFRASAAL